MLPTLLLIIAAMGLALYALHELAPDRWTWVVGGLRGATLAPPRPALPGAGRPTPRAAGSAVGTADVRAGERSVARTIALWAPLAVVALALVVRLINLTGVPYGFFCDEASPALDAYFVAHTLHDQHGVFLPAYFEALGEWPGGFQTYWDVPFVVLFGLTEFASRFAAVIAGILTVWLTYVFVSKASNRTIGLIAAFLLAISPWHIMQSRVGWQVINLPLLIALCLTFLYLGLERPRLLPLAVASGALGIYGYFPGRVFFPLLAIAIAAIYARPLLRQWRMVAIGVAVAFVMLIPTALALVNGTAFARLNQFSGLSGTFSQKLATYTSNYLAQYSPDFLLHTSDWITRHFVRGFGLLYPIEVPFIILGVLVMLWRRQRFDLLCLVWLIIYPAAAALVGPPILTRAIAGLIVLQIAAAQGVYALLLGVRWLAARSTALHHYRILAAPAVGVLLLLVGFGATQNFMSAYLHDYPLYSSGWDGWQWGAGQIVSYFEAHRNSYDAAYMDAEFNAPDELLRFYATPYSDQCARCTVTNVADPNVIRATYQPHLRQLWAVGPSVLQGPPASALGQVPHRIVGHLTYPNGQIAFLFIATGPGAR